MQLRSEESLDGVFEPTTVCLYGRQTKCLTTALLNSKYCVVLSEYGKSGIVLNQVDMFYYNMNTCSQPSWYGDMIWRKQICFGHAEGGKGTCQGDSGGPLVCYGRLGQCWTLHGLTSWAMGGCAAVNRPTIFTDVAYYVEWIGEQIERDEQEEQRVEDDEYDDSLYNYYLYHYYYPNNYYY